MSKRTVYEYMLWWSILFFSFFCLWGEDYHVTAVNFTSPYILFFIVAGLLSCQFFYRNHLLRIEVKRKTASLKLNEERIETLWRINRQEGKTGRELALYALEDAVRLSQSTCGYFHRYDELTQSVSLNIWTKNVMEACTAPGRGHYALEEAGAWADAIRRREPVFHNNYPEMTGKKGLPKGHLQLRRHMAVPVIIENHIVAIAGVGNKAKPYDEEDAHRLSLLMTGAWQIIRRKEAEEEKKGLEGQLRQARKLESIGTMAGGIAHDFNNILSAILGYAELVRNELPAVSSVYKRQDQVVKAAMRAKELVKRILLFSRRTDQERVPVQPHLIIEEVVKLLEPSIPGTIEIKENFPGCGSILADPTQVHQVVMNLATNAFHAMREKGGVLGLALSRIKITPPDIALNNLKLAPGNYAKLEVSDSGHGIDPITREKIFNPYFTTKPKGEGTGLGLAVVNGIVKSYGGYIDVYSEPGIGTSFHVYFPALDIDVHADEE